MSRTRRPLEQLSLGRILDPSPVSPLISTRNLVPGLSSSVVKLDKLGKGETCRGVQLLFELTIVTRNRQLLLAYSNDGLHRFRCVYPVLAVVK